MFIKVHKSYRDVIAVCDSEIIGRSFEEGVRVLNVRENFYNGERKTEKEAIEFMSEAVKEDATFNIVGKKSVACALKAGIISEEGIKTVQGIPFALVLL